MVGALFPLIYVFLDEVERTARKASGFSVQVWEIQVNELMCDWV